MGDVANLKKISTEGVPSHRTLTLQKPDRWRPCAPGWSSPFEAQKRPAAFETTRGPIVPEEALFAPAASLGGPMYPTANIQAVHGPQRL